MDIQEFVYPEADSAERLAYKLDLKGFVDAYKINEKFQLIEVLVPERYIDQTIGDIDFISKYNIQPVTVIRSTEHKNILVSSHRIKQVIGLLNAETQLRRGDRLLLFGEVNKLEEFIED